MALIEYPDQLVKIDEIVNATEYETHLNEQ